MNVYKQLFKRNITNTLIETAKSFPITALTGPRQSGKTTLLKYLFPSRDYINLEDPDRFLMVSSDIRGFLNDGKPRIIDEAQRLPELFSYLQGHVDKDPIPGQFILSGSQNFLLSEKISQTLAGRVGLLELLPLSYSEYLTHPQSKDLAIWDFLYHGSYPRPYNENLDVTIWFNSYIKTYLERDVRSLINIKDLNTFHRFLQLCAGRHGQLLNLNELANDTGISQTTATNWINILEASYIVYRLQPYYKNFNKRIIKTPKLFFYDSAIVCRLLGIESPAHLKIHVNRGQIFEGFIISEIIKYFFSKGATAPVYFWRDHRGTEIDLVIERFDKEYAIELKSGQTFDTTYIKSLTEWQKITGNQPKHSYVVFTGNENIKFNNIEILSWKQLVRNIEKIFEN